MIRKHNPKLTGTARCLRRNMTPEERHLWYDFLRTYPVRFLRQKILGSYVVDFYCAKAKLVVEIDGAQHYAGTGPQRDAIRTAFLEGYRLRVLRIPNSEVNRNFRGVCAWIDLQVQRALQYDGDTSKDA